MPFDQWSGGGFSGMIEGLDEAKTMTPFWCGYFAGMIAISLPSLIALAILLARAPVLPDPSAGPRRA